MQRLVEGDPVELLVCDIDGSDGVSRRDPAEITPNGKRYRLVEETDNPKVLKHPRSSIDDYLKKRWDWE